MAGFEALELPLNLLSVVHYRRTRMSFINFTRDTIVDCRLFL